MRPERIVSSSRARLASVGMATALLVACSVACSDASSPPAPGSGGPGAADAGRDAGAATAVTVKGSYGGAPFRGKGGGIRRLKWQGDGGLADVYAGVSLMISQSADACNAPRDTTGATISLSLRSTALTLGAGNFTVSASSDAGPLGAPPDAVVSLVQLHPGDCYGTPLDQATAGTVTLSVVDRNHIEGTFDLTFASNGSFTGAFSLADCRDVTPGDYLDPTIACAL